MTKTIRYQQAIQPSDVIFWWLVVIGMLAWLHTCLVADISYGDILGFVVPLTVAALWWAYHKWRIYFPYRVTFPTTEPIKALEYDRAEKKQWVAPRGYSLVRVRIRNRFGTSLEWFSPRLGIRRWRPGRRPLLKHLFLKTWDNERREIVAIHGLFMLPKRGLAVEAERILTDEVDVHLKSFLWSAKEPLEFQLLIQANREWNGFISFYSRNDKHDLRRWGRACLKVTMDPSRCDGISLAESDVVAMKEDPKWRLKSGEDA